MAYSYVTYKGTGSLTNFTFPYPYLDKTNISVTVDTNPVSFTWLNDSTIVISPAPPVDSRIVITRATEKSRLLVDFNDGSVLTEKDLDAANRQVFFMAQETLDESEISLAAFDTYIQQAAESANQSYTYERLAYDSKENATDAADAAAVSKDLAGAFAEQAEMASANVQAQVNAADASAAAAAASVTAAAASVTAATAKAGEAAASATASASSATAAQAAAATVAKYIGPAASNPTTRIDGSALQAGDLYFNTVGSEMRVYNGAVWQAQAASPDTMAERSFVATAGQTSYTFTGGYRVGYTYVYVNGVLLDATDIVATNGTTITFNSALALNDEVRILSFKAVGTVAVGDISGLQSTLDSKAATSSLATVATTGAYTDLTGKPTLFSGAYADLSGKPTIPSATSGLTNDSGFITGTAPTITGLKETKVAMAANNIDCAAGNVFTKTISGATTLTVSNVAASGSVSEFILKLTNGGSATITWFSGVKWAGGTAPTLTSAGLDNIGFFTDDGGTTWHGAVISKDSK